jgi:hypothetical protein
MGFASGSISFRRFAIQGQQPPAFDQSILDKLESHALQPGEFGVPEELEYGWCGGRHVLDANFGFEHNIFADALCCAMRVDTNRVPGELKKAYQIIEEEAAAAGNPSGLISRRQKKDVKDIVRRKLEEDLRSGRFRRSRLVPVLWDLPGATMFSPAGTSQFELLSELWERTLGSSLEPLTAGELALRHLAEKGRRREYEDARPTRFVPGPEGESQVPDYPWTAKGPQPKDFFGNEFLLWLWHRIETDGGIIKAEGAGEVSVVIDQSLDLECAFGQTGRDGLRGDGPTRMPEAVDALRSGKLPRKVGMILETGGRQFQFTLSAESLGCSGVKMPEIEEAENPRVVFEERIVMLRDLCKAIDGLFFSFLRLRASSAWEGQVGGIRKWILRPARHAAA